MSTYLNSNAIVNKSITEDKLAEGVQQKLDKADSIEQLTTSEINEILV